MPRKKIEIAQDIEYLSILDENANVDKALEANRLHIEATRVKVAASLASKKKPAALSVVNRKTK